MIRGLSFMPGTYVGPGYSRLGRLGYATGSRAVGFGDIQGDAATAVSLGIVDQQTMDVLLGMGATDDQIVALINGQIDPITLQTQLQQQALGLSTTAPVPLPSMQYEPTDWAGYGVESALANLNSDITQLETWSSASTAVKNDIGPQIQAARAQYNSWHATYQNWVNQSSAPQVVTMPDGTQQIVAPPLQAGMNPLVIVAVAAVVALAATVAYYHSQTVQGLIAKAQADMTATGQQAYGQYIHALPPGSVPVPPQLPGSPQPPQPPQPTSWTLWLQQNTGLVIGALTLIFVAPPLLGAFGGGRRR